MFRALLVLLSGASISIFAALMSVVGMHALFPAAGWVIVAAMIALEIAKLVSAEWVHDHWKNSDVSRLHKTYMVSAIVALMLITSMGIYGYLAKGHLEAAAPIAPVELQIAQKEERLKQLEADLQRYQTQQNQLNASVDAFLKNDDAKAGLKARRSMGHERGSVQKNIDTTNSEINSINQSLVPLKVKVTEVDAKLGPIKYLAQAIGLKDPEAAVRIVICILMFAFDPLAVVMLISASITMTKWFERRRAADHEIRFANEQQESIFPKFMVDVPMPDIPMPPVEPVIEPVIEPAEFDAEEEKSIVKPITYPDVEPANEPDIVPDLDDLPLTSDFAFEQPENLLKELHEMSEERREREAEADHPAISDKEILIALLEENPDLLQEMIEVVDEARRESEPAPASPPSSPSGDNYTSWLDDPPRK